jgi:hypothetical protein
VLLQYYLTGLNPNRLSHTGVTLQQIVTMKELRNGRQLHLTEYVTMLILSRLRTRERYVRLAEEALEAKQQRCEYWIRVLRILADYVPRYSSRGSFQAST